jgi:hypothetical protein
VIHEVDESLRTLLKRDALNGANIEVLFDAPTKDWGARRNTPTLDVYLYDIREDMRWRHYGTVDVRNDADLVAGRANPPRWFKLSYLLTAWTQRPEDEHRILSAVLMAFLRQDMLPKDVLTEPLRELGQTIRVTIGLPPPEDRSLSDVWSALGGELKPSLDLVVSVPIDAVGVKEVGPLVLEEPRFSFDGEEVGGRRRRGPYTAAELAPREPMEEEVSRGTAHQRGRIFHLRDSPVPPTKAQRAEKAEKAAAKAAKSGKKEA